MSRRREDRKEKQGAVMRTIWIVMLLMMTAVVGFAASGPEHPTPVSGPGVTLPDGLKYWDLKVGTGKVAEAGETVRVHYTGWLLANGRKFDSSLDRGQPFDFTLGAGQVIRGWDEGVAGMRVGGKRQLRIPPSLGYGMSGAAGVIPPNAYLIFDVELLAVN
jgi:FKBP-type peptidyl-prolyl cis-trans isomerase FkpA